MRIISLLPHEWRYIENWRREMERFLTPLTQDINSPRVDVYETEDEVIAHCELPGIEKKEDVAIDVADNTLIISGTVRRSLDFKEESIHRRERYAGSFHRSVALPVAVDKERVRARYKNGILEVRMPRTGQTSARAVDIEFK